MFNVSHLRNVCFPLSTPDYRFFAMILTGRSLETHKGRFGQSASLSQLTPEDAALVRRTVTGNMDKTIFILRALPKEMLLVFRLVSTMHYML